MVDRRPRPYLDLMLWAGLAGGSGLPAAVVPMGLGKDRLPRGVEIIAAARQDRTAIAVARILEALGTGFEPPPILNNS
jgi:Asp-tRNA(Asn)/Glu-tRNA(Gln) amidotransferase A subunit family amidase